VIDSDTDGDGDGDKDRGCDEDGDGDGEDDQIYRCTSKILDKLAPNGGSMAETVSPITQQLADEGIAASVLFYQAINDDLLSVMSSSILRLIDCSLSEPFLQPVTDLIAPSYHNIISHPMDLGTIEESIREGLYVKSIFIHSSDDDDDNDDKASIAQQYVLSDIQSFVDDVRLVWSNCLLFNGATSPLTRSAYLLSHLFETTLRENLSMATRQRGMLSIKKIPISSCDANDDGGIDKQDDDGDRSNSSGNDNDDQDDDDDQDDMTSNFLITFLSKGIGRITPCSVFVDKDCSSLRRSLPPSKMTSLLANTMVSSDRPVFASADEALAPYMVPQGERETLLINAEINRANYSKSRSSSSSSSSGVIGLEYENECSNYGANLFSWPVSRSVTCGVDGGDRDDGGISVSVSSLTSIDCYLNRFCDADVITSFASYSSNYECCDADELECMSLDDSDVVDPSVQASREVPDKQHKSFADFYVAGTTIFVFILPSILISPLLHCSISINLNIYQSIYMTIYLSTYQSIRIIYLLYACIRATTW